MIGVYIQTVPGREAVLAGLEQSLQQSDVGRDYTVLQHQPGETVAEFFVRLLRTMSGSHRKLVLRLEDDALVNRHLVHNCTTWEMARQDDFGVGWLYSPPMSVLDYIYQRRVNNPWRKRLVCGCVGTLFRTADLPWIIEGCERWFAQKGGDAMDFAISSAVYDAGRLLYLHDPPIVEHRTEVKSSLGHAIWPEHSTCGTFRPEWRRST